MKPFSDPWDNSIRGTPLTVAYTIACGIAFYINGYDQGVMGGLIGSPYFLEVFPSLESNPNLLGTTVAIYEVGALIGSFICSVYGDYFGRRLNLIFASIIVFIGAALQAAAVNLTMFIVFRVVTGFAIGILTSIAPVFLSECVSARHRGKLVSFQLVLGSVGLTSSFWIDYGCSFVPNQFAWRFPVAFQCFFPCVTVILLLFLPDSPRWYVDQGRIEEARSMLYRLNGESKGAAILHDIQEALALEREVGAKSYWNIFKKNDQNFRYRTILAMGSLFFQQMTGVNMISYYSAAIFQNSVGLSANLSLLLSGFNGLNSLFWVTFSTLFLIDRVGRVRLMMGTAVIQACAMAVLAGVLRDVESSKSNGIVGAAMLFLFFTTFSIGWLAPGWIYPAEITPLAIRATASSLGSASNWIWNFVVVEVTPPGIANIGSYYYIIYAITNIIMVPLLYIFFPETAQLSLEEVDLLFLDGKIIMRRSPRERVGHVRRITQISEDFPIDEKESGDLMKGRQ